MTARVLRIAGISLAIAALAFLIWRSFTKPAPPAAILRVVDAGGQPVPGAIIKREGLRTKPGAYRSGWYGWNTETYGTNSPVVTDANGEARIEYPKYVFEKVDTGVVCLTVEHPDFVSQRPERDVDTSLPENAPMRDRIVDGFHRFVNNKPLTARPDPIILKKGGILKLSISGDARLSPDAPLWAQVSRWNYDTSFWIHPGPGLIATRRLAEGTQAVRISQFGPAGAAWFSDVTNVFSKAGQTVELSLLLKPGVAVRGKLDDTVPRPVTKGRVIVEVHPPGLSPDEEPPHWHSWTQVRSDGTFEFPSLPNGDLEIAAICDGFINTNGAGKFANQFHYPQQYKLSATALDIVIGMQPTTRLEVAVEDQKGRPVANAKITAWPNLRWADWGAVVFGTDLYDCGEWMRGEASPRAEREFAYHDFDATTDARGIALISNLPLSVNQLAVLHPQYQIPAFENSGRDDRSAKVTLSASRTNYLKIVVEPISERAKLQHR